MWESPQRDRLEAGGLLGVLADGGGSWAPLERQCRRASPQTPQLLWKIPYQKQREEVWLEVLEPIPGLGSG